MVPRGKARTQVFLTRRCSRPAAAGALGLSAQPRAAGLLSGSVVRWASTRRRLLTVTSLLLEAVS